MSIERLDPFHTGDLLNARYHVERYEWARRHVQGKDVLDIACGVGYGSAMLADSESRPAVLGVDRSAEAIEAASARYASERVSFLRFEDAERFETERRFDTAVSLETIEHLPHPRRFLRRLHALLREGGRLILSTPVRERWCENPFHLQCFTPGSMRALVGEGFEIEDVLDQDGLYHTVSARRRDKYLARPTAIVFCERIDNESFCESIARALEERYEVRPCGPGWPLARLEDVDASDARFYLELDAASGNFHRPTGLGSLTIPKFAWLIDVHKKPDYHRAIARDVDLTFFAMRTWGHALEGRTQWLPLHADERLFQPREAERDIDVCFVGSQCWRAAPIERIAKKHGLRTLVTTTTGSREKSETAAIYARSKIVFNKHVTNDLNFRVFEALAAGRALVTDAQDNGQYELFEDGKHLVLYKDERDLERFILELLGDDRRRASMEREAVAVAREHSTRARVRQLVEHIERHLGEPEAPAAARVTASGPTAGRRRSLVLAGDAPATVEMRSPAERRAWALARRGHAVTIVRPRRCRLPLPRPREGEPTILELHAGPAPRSSKEPNASLALAASFRAQVEAIVREHGPFDVVLAEGALGSLIAATLAPRWKLPWILALETCEVARRKNKLTREQLYMAELEHWAAERASGVLVARESHVAAVREHYRATKAMYLPAAPVEGLRVPQGAARLLRALGIEGGLRVALEPTDDAAARAPGEGEVVCGREVRLHEAGGEVRTISRRPLEGPALAALLACATGVTALDPDDPRLAEAAALGARTGRVLDGRDDGVDRLEALLEKLLSRTRARATEAAHVLR